MIDIATDFQDRMLSLGLARVSEAAAIASARMIGRGDEKEADRVAVEAMREQLNMLDIKGTVVIGEGERDEAPMLFIGEEVGSGEGIEVDIALDPLEGTTLTAKAMPNALTVVAMGPRHSMLHAPDVYMDKLAIGPGFADGLVDLDMAPAERIRIFAEAKGCGMDGVTVCVLERPRHAEMVKETARDWVLNPADHRWRRCRCHALRRTGADRHRHVHGIGRRPRGGSGRRRAEMHGRADPGDDCCSGTMTRSAGRARRVSTISTPSTRATRCAGKT